jgi:hypothetical protein
MRKLVVDFDLTILAPFLLWLLIALWNAVRVYRWASDELCERREGAREAERTFDWDSERREEKRKAKSMIWISSIVSVLVCGVWLMSDRWKISVAYQAWWILHFVSPFAFLFSAGCAWHYARRQERMKLMACLLAMLFMAASAEHFFHQTSNSGRIACPGCDDDQSDDQ